MKGSSLLILVGPLLWAGGLFVYALQSRRGRARLHPFETYSLMALGLAVALWGAISQGSALNWAAFLTLTTSSAVFLYWTLIYSVTPGVALRVGPGDLFPDLTLRDSRGEEFSTRGGDCPTLYVFYRGHW